MGKCELQQGDATTPLLAWPQSGALTPMLASHSLRVGYKLVQLLWKTVRLFLRKLSIFLAYNPAITLHGPYPKELKHICPHKNGHTTVPAPLFKAAKRGGPSAG